MNRIKLKSNKGFTIVELMIALSVLSVILIVATAVMIQISGLYSKGVNAANLQNNTRNVVADLSSVLQFSEVPPYSCTDITLTCYANQIDTAHPNPHEYTNGSIRLNVYAYCVGTTRYSYALNRELGEDSGLSANSQSPHVFWRDTIKASAPCLPLDLTNRTILGDSSSVEGSGVKSKGFEMMGEHMRLTRFKIMESPVNSGIYKLEVWTAFGDSDLLNIDGPGKANCLSGHGTQYCSTSQITTNVVGRVY